MSKGAISSALREDLRRRGLPLLDVSDLEEAPRGAAGELELQPGALLELLPPGAMGVIAGSWSSGKTSLALTEVAAVTAGGGRAAVVDGSGWLFPPVLTLWGGRLERVLVVKPTVERVLWTTEQLLRSGVFELTVLLGAERLSRGTLRRLQLAAERSAGRALVVRQGAIGGELASLRLQVEPIPPRADRLSAIAAPPRTCRVRLVTRGREGARPPRWAEVALA